MALGFKEVAGPAFTPASYTLLDYVQWIDDPDPHWKAGIKWMSFCGPGFVTFDPCLLSVTGAPVEQLVKPATISHEWRAAEPFAVVARIDCSPVGWWENARADIINQLSRVEAQRVENTFMNGQAGFAVNRIHPHLADDTEILVPEAGVQLLLQPAASVLVTGAPVDVTEGLGLLEQHLATCGYLGIGVVHVNVPTFDQMIAEGLVFLRGNKWVTGKGNWVVPGYGYGITTGPDDTQPAPGSGTAWMYITGAVFGRRSNIFVNGDTIDDFIRNSLDRQVNTLEAIAERTYILGWDCCQAAVLVSTGGTITGSPNSAT